MSITYSKDILEQPTHLSLAFFEEVTENALRETNLKIENVQISMGSSAGENYCSQIFRVKVLYQLNDSDKLKELSVIVKSMPNREAIEFLQELRVFLKEKVTFHEVLPRMQMFLEGDERFCARLYHSLKSPVNTLVFEDLSTSDFEMASREFGLDEDHCRLVIQRLAKLHGISMFFSKKDPDLMKCYSSGILGKVGLNDDKGMLMRFFGANAESLIELISKWPGYESITEKVKNYNANLYKNLVRSQEPLPGEVQVLNHGDLWVNNILFSYDSVAGVKRQLKDVIFVDFQLSVWGSPGIDLNYFFYTSLSLDVLKHKREALIMEYHKELSSVLRKLNYAHVPSLKQIRREVQQRELFGFFANYAIYPIVSMDKQVSGDSNLDNFADEEFTRNKMAQMFSSKRLAETLRYTLKEFDAMGIWD